MDESFQCSREWLHPIPIGQQRDYSIGRLRSRTCQIDVPLPPAIVGNFPRRTRRLPLSHQVALAGQPWRRRESGLSCFMENSASRLGAGFGQQLPHTGFRNVPVIGRQWRELRIDLKTFREPRERLFEATLLSRR